MSEAPLSVGGLWHYPVTSLAGKRLPAPELTPDGIPGERDVLVLGSEGVRRGPKGSELPDAITDSSDFRDHSRRIVRFDILPLLVATDGAVLWRSASHAAECRRRP